MGDRGVSLESVVQRKDRMCRDKSGADQPVPVIIVTHETTEVAIRAALEAIAADEAVVEPPQLIRIERL